MKNSKLYDQLLKLIDELVDEYPIMGEQEYENIITFFDENDSPLFKLIYLKKNEQFPESIYVMFHLDLIPSQAIVWFTRIRALNQDVGISEDWVEVNGEVLTGAEAQIYKWENSDKNLEKDNNLQDLDGKAFSDLKSAYKALKSVKRKGKGKGH